jgi:hypothetical protein
MDLQKIARAWNLDAEVLEQEAARFEAGGSV